MNYFVEKTHKPSVAIEAMIKSLYRQDKRKLFTINMSTYGGTAEGECFGCAATCTIMQITGVNFTPNDDIWGGVARASILAKQLNIKDINIFRINLGVFEVAIENFRTGKPENLLSLYAIEDTDKNRHLYDGQSWRLETENWKSQIPSIKAYVTELKAVGL